MSDYEKFRKRLLDLHLDLHNAGLQPIADNIEGALWDLSYAKQEGYVE